MQFQKGAVREALGEIQFLLPSIISRLKSTMPNSAEEYEVHQKFIASLNRLETCVEYLIVQFDSDDADETIKKVDGYWRQFMSGITQDGKKHGHVAGMTLLTAASVSLLNAAGLPVALGSVASLAMVFGQERAERIVNAGISLIKGNEGEGAFKVPKINERLVLTKRQRQCLTLAAEGNTTADICRILTLNQNTVDNHIRFASYKLGTSSRERAIEIAVENGIISPKSVVGTKQGTFTLK